MAKSKEADVEVEGEGIDGETSEMLEGDVKKGKARKFILIYKGAQIKKLIVFKKGPYQTRIQKARKDGFKGDAICGVVTGSGVNLTFQLAGNKEVADAMSVDAAIEDEPTKTTKLKEFLAENNLARKPEYQIIRDVSAFAKPEGEDEAAAPGAAGAATATQPQPLKAGAAPPADPDLAAKIKQIKAAVLPKVKDAVASDPAKKAEIVQLLETATKQEKDESWGDAFKSLKLLAETVKDAIVGVGDRAKYELSLAAAELKVSTLKGHKQSAVIAAELTKFDGYLRDAKAKAANRDYDGGCKELAKLESEYPEAKRQADNTQIGRDREAAFKSQFADLKLHQGYDGVPASNITELETKLAEFGAMVTERRWNDYGTIDADVAAKLKAMKERANRHGDYVGLRSNAQLMVKALEGHPNKSAITAEIAAINTDLIEKAKTEYEANADPTQEVARYNKAQALLAQVETKYKAALTKADTEAKSKYETARNAAQVKLTALDKAEKQAVVGKEIAAIKAQLALAEKRAGVQQFSEAMTLIAEMDKACDAAEKLAKQALELNQAEKTAGDAMKNTEKDPKAAIAAVEKLHAQLKVHPQAEVISTELESIKKKIDQAKAVVGK